MKSMIDQLANYAAYHRDRRNIWTHFIGIPMIMFSVVILLSRPFFGEVGSISLNPAIFAAIIVGLYYLRLDLRFGILMSLILALMVVLAYPIAEAGMNTWLGWGIGLFVVGWIIQAVGHIFEGRKPAFLDDLIGLIIGPLFVTVEIVCALGMRKEVMAEIERRVGPPRTGPVKAQDTPPTKKIS